MIYVEPYGSCGGHTPCYGSIQYAADAAVYGGTLKVADDDYDEDLEPGAWGNLILEGGWNHSFTSRSPISPTSGTTMTGTLIIGADMEGALMVDGLVLAGGSGSTKPTVTTATVTNITTSTATSGGNVTSDGGASVTARGVCWSTSVNPTTSNSKTTNGSGTGSFTSSLTGLSPSTTYHVRAYATNSMGTSYGSDITFTTSSSATKPTVTTATVTNITASTATSGGNVTSDGGAAVTVRGVCWSTSVNPTTSNSKTTNGSGTGSFTSSITGLSQGTTYHVRAYATNSVGTSYGSDRTFTTHATATASAVFYNDLSCGGDSFYATVTIDGKTLTSLSGQYSNCENIACGVDLEWHFYADTGGCGTYSAHSVIASACDCLYEFVLTLDESDELIIYIFSDCPGDCSDVMFSRPGSRRIGERITISRDAEAMGLQVFESLTSK